MFEIRKGNKLNEKKQSVNIAKLMFTFCLSSLHEDVNNNKVVGLEHGICVWN
jgi:hypothetical protein